MTKCYHQKCDHYNQDVIKPKNFEFLAAISQSIMLSVIEMAMEKEESTCIPKTVQHIIQKATSTMVYEKTSTLPTTKPPLRSTTLSQSTFSSTTTQQTSTMPSVEENIVEVEENYLSSIDEIDISIKDMVKQELSKLVPHLKVPAIDTQINIQTLNVDIGTLNVDNSKQCPIGGIDTTSGEGLVLSHDDVLSNLVKNYYVSANDEKTDRREYAGKFRNSPMLIKFVE